MGKLKSLRKDRADVRAHTSALKAKARTEARLAAKEVREKAREAHLLELADAKQRAKLARKVSGRDAKRDDKAAKRDAKLARTTAKRTVAAEKTLAKQDAKQLKRESGVTAKERKQAEKIAKAGRKHEYQMAEMELKKIDAGKLGKKDVKRWIDIAQVAVPVVVPLVYKGLSTLGTSSPGGAKDARRGGVRATGAGAALGGRVVRLEQTLDTYDSRGVRDEAAKDFSARTHARLRDLREAVESAEALPTAQRRETHKAISGEIDRVNRDILARLGVKP